MRISDWSSDVCSSDLSSAGRGDGAQRGIASPGFSRSIAVLVGRGRDRVHSFPRPMCSNEDEKGPKSAAILSSRGVSSEAMSLNFHINSQNNIYDIDSPPSRARFRRGSFE